MPDNVNQVLAIHQAAHILLKQGVKQLQIIPELALKLICLKDDPNISVAILTELIVNEPTLTAKILNNVNAIAAPLYPDIKSIKQAIKILGVSTVKQLALNQSIYNKLIYSKANFDFEQILFWQHCLYVATLSRTIAKALNHTNPDEIYSAGLLHDIGKIILETYSNVSYSDFIRSCREQDLAPLFSEEHPFFGLNHAEMGYIFSQQWQLSERISACIFCHHDMPDINSPMAKFNLDIAIISLANCIASGQGIGSTTTLHQLLLHPEVTSHIDLNKIDIKKILNAVDNEMQNTCAFFDTKLPNLETLRSSLIKSTILSCQPNEQTDLLPGNISISSLTIPHKSLNLDEIIPATLKTIHQDFHFDRLVMLNINPKQRSLEASYYWPISLDGSTLQHFNIKMDILPDVILKNLRERNAVIVNSHHEENRPLLDTLKVDEFLLLPVISNDRLVALLYADYSESHQAIDTLCITHIAPIIHELGIALANAHRFIQERHRAELDSLTGLSNSRMLIEFLSSTFKLSMHQLNQVAVGFIDIDYFKKFNDTCGHQVGDEAIIMVAQIMRSLTRPGDFIGRYGGDEFVFVLQSTDKKGVDSYAERIRLEVEQQGKLLSKKFQGHKITISIGVSLYHQDFNSYDKIITAADTAMYQAKQKGRNCVVII